MSRYMNLTVVEVHGPVRILARETPGPTASVETAEYASFFKEMNNYFNNDILTFEIYSPKSNEICAALNCHNNWWHRVRVREIMATLSGAKADCFFLDTGEKQMVPIVKMKKIPEKFLTVPFQVKVFALYGLQPLSLVLDPTMTACKKPCKKWDKSAAIHIKKLINSASAIQAVIKSRGEENVLLAVIYLRFSGSDEILSLNDEMVSKGYAIKDSKINKSFDEETNNFLQDVFQTKRLSQKPEQPEYPVYNSSVNSSVPLNYCPVRVEETSISDIPQVNSSDDDSDSSSSSNCQRKKFVTKRSRKIRSSSNIPFTNQQTSSNFSAMEQLLSYHKRLQQNNKIEKESDSSLSAQSSRNVTYSCSSGRQRSPVEPKVPKVKPHENISPSKSVYKPRISPIKPVSHHKDNFSPPKISQKLKSHPVNYHLPNVEKNPCQAESNGCNLYLSLPILESDSSYMTEASEMFYDSDEAIQKNSFSTVISTNHSKKAISKDSLVKNQQKSPENVSNVKTESALNNFLAFHKKLVSSQQDSIPNGVGPKDNDYFSKLSAKRCAEDLNNQSKNSSAISYCKRTTLRETHQNNSVHNDKCDSKIRLSSYVPPQTIFNQTSLARQPLSVTDDYLNNSVHCYQTESDVPFNEIQPEDDVRSSSAMDFHCDRVKKSQKINLPLLDNSDCAQTRESERKRSFSSQNSDRSDESFLISNKTLNEKDEDIVSCNIVTDERKNIISNPTGCSTRKNICSESENSESCQSNASSKETVITSSVLSSSVLSSSAVNMLNHSVSSKLLSSSSENTIRMLQGLNTLPLNKLNEYQNGISSKSVFPKEYQPFTSFDNSDLSETGDDKLYLSGTFGFYSGKSSSENSKNKFGNPEREVVTSDDSSQIIPSQDFSDTKCLSRATSPVSSLNDEETFSSGCKSLVGSLQPQISSREQNLIFEDEMEKPIINSKQEYLSLSKIENLPEMPAVIADFEQDHSVTDMKTNDKYIDTFTCEGLKEENVDSSFEFSTANENHDFTNTDLFTHKDCIEASDSANSHKPATDTAISQENKTEDILPPFTSGNQEKDLSVEITSGNYESSVLSRKSSVENLDEKVLSYDESEKNDTIECLKSVEQAEGCNDCAPSVDIASGSVLETRSVSLALSSIEDSKPVDIKDIPIICKDNTESTSILEKALNEYIESPSITMPSKTNYYEEMPRLEDDIASVSLSTLPGVCKSMPALIDQSTDSELSSPAKDPTSVSMLDLTDATAISDLSELLSPFKNLEKDSVSSSLPDLKDATIETKFTSLSVNMNKDVLSDYQSSIAGPDDVTESEASSVKTSSEIQVFESETCNAESSFLDNCNESVTSSDDVEIKVTSDNDVDSILPAAPSAPDTSHDLLSVIDNEMFHSELIEPLIPSKTDDKSEITLSSELHNFDLYKNNDPCSDRTHTIPNGNALSISETTLDDNTQTISAGIAQTISSPGDMKPNTIPVSLSIQVSPDQDKKDPSDSVEKNPNVRDHTMDCIRGRRILEKLGVSNKVQKVGNDHSQFLSTESILLNDSVLFVAEKIPSPIYNLQDFNVPQVLSLLIENLNIQPKPIQAYSWGPVIRGKNVIGISPSGSGKTLAYIVPILASLSQYNIYSDIKFSNGPFVLILVPSWEKAISVYEQCKRISQINREIVVEVVYGGGGEESKKTVNLLNGCHILVATLPCFLRMLESKFTNLDRLCHLVIDEADILLQDFYKEIVDLMCKYRSLVEYRDKSYQRHQVLAYSSKWTSYIDGFVKNAIHDPVIVITDMMEASVYGRVKQILIMCVESERKDQLVKLVPQIIKKGEKVIIFAMDDECFELQILLDHILQKPVSVACNAQYKSEWEIISAEWKLPLSENEPCRVLVTSDLALCDLYINDATCIVHYQMPKRKIHIGLRIQAMSNYYQHYNNNKNPDKIVKSYILITPEDKKQVKSLKSFLMRSTDVTDKDTWDFLSNIRQLEDSDPEKELCRNLKAFGKCRNKHQCENRHCVVPSADLNGACSQHICLPPQGDVRVKILHVKAANNFYVRILEHQIGSKKSIQVHSDLASLIMGMALYYSNHSNRKVLDELKSGVLCVVNTSEQFSRVKVLQPYDNASKNTASLFFVDIGKVESHPICNLYKLSEEFKKIPFQAVEVFLCRLYPIDADTKWTPAANSFAESWLETKMLYGKIRFVMDNTLWLDPLLERTFLKAIKTVTNGPSLRKELINNNLAIDNPQHLIQLHKLFEGYVPKMIPSDKLHTSCPTWEFDLQSETLQPGDDYEDVTISYIFNPEHFYVQKLDMKICLNDLMIKLQKKMNLETEPQQKREWVTGMHCLSKSSLDFRWYRVIILTLLDSKAVVHFVDYGNIEEVCIDELHTMPRELMYLPSQAIECKLAHIKSSEDVWSTKCNDFMYYMTMTADNVYKTLAVNVVHEVPTEGKLPQYYVNLLDTSYQRVINIAQELVWWKMAITIDDFFQPLFPKPVTLKMFYPCASKLKDMCAVLYHEQASSEQYSQLIRSYLRVCLDHPEKLIEENVSECFLKLLSYTHELDTFTSTVDYVKLLMSNPRMFDNLVSNGILQSLGQVLKMHDDVNILHMTLQLIQFMTEINTSLIRTIASLKAGLFSILCEIVKSIYPNEIRTTVCHLLELFCLADQKCTENLIELQICPLFLPNVLEIEDHDFTEAYLSLLDPVSRLDSGLVAVKREKSIQKIMEIVEKGSCEKCVCKCLVVLKRLAEKSRKNKTQLLELNAVAILTSCQNLLYGTEAATLCQELLDGILVKVNYQQNSNLAICTQLQPTNESNFHVLWCQNKFRLLITLKINHFEWSDCQFQKTSIHFSFVLPDGVQQSVDYELFDEVIVDKCSFCVQNNDVILSLCKAEAKYWPRLLQDKYNKPPNLFVDFEKIEDSDDSGSDEFEADEENPFTLQVVVKKTLIEIVKKKSSNYEAEEEAVPLPVDTAESDEDSLENSDFEEYDRFNIFNTKYS